MTSRALTVVSALLAIAASCSPFDAATTPGERTNDGGASGPGPGPAPAAADGAPADPCPNDGRGPTMVRAGNVCIDSTPVTNGQFRAFLADTARPVFDGTVCDQPAPTDISKPVPGCRGVDGNRQEIFTNPMMPAVCVTICDARAFCEWAGRHLCGGLDGRPQSHPQAIGHDLDEWTHACTKNGTHLYSTGQTWNPSGCVVKEGPLPSPQPVDREPRCEGPPGVFDLIGNVVVWIDACTTTSCRCAGESKDWRSTEAIGLDDENAPGRCDAIDTNPPDDRATDLGFRCCAAPK